MTLFRAKLLLSALMATACMACSGVQKPNEAPTMKQAFLAHANTQTSCNQCHAADLPGSNQMEPKAALKKSHIFYHQAAYTSGQDCFACHSTPANFGVSFSGGKFKHPRTAVTQCMSCHSDDIPSADEASPQPSNDDPNPSKENQFFHSEDYVANQDCIQCHAINMGKNWREAKYPHLDSNKNLVQTCKDCHSHLAVNQHQGHSTYLNYKTPDCNACHAKSYLDGDILHLNWGQ